MQSVHLVLEVFTNFGRYHAGLHVAKLLYLAHIVGHFCWLACHTDHSQHSSHPYMLWNVVWLR